MSLIVMVVFDTVENDRTKYTRQAIASLHRSVDTSGGKHRVLIVDNDSCLETKNVIQYAIDTYENWEVYRCIKNIGTAEAWNMGVRQRMPGQHVIKIDNDIVINGCDNWVEQMEEVVRIEPTIGQVGLKRKDCSETTTNPAKFYRSVIQQLPHVPGERWVIVEKQFHVMGSCVLHSSALLDKIGFMYQIGLYGFDDSFMSARAIKAGFQPVMLPHIDIDHIDGGDNPYTQHKQKLANDVWAAGQYISTMNDINAGRYYYDGNTKQLTEPPNA